MYKFSVWDFDDKEIDQITEIIRAWGTGESSLFNGHGALDRRKVTKQVFQWAKDRYLIQKGQDITYYSNGDYVHPGYVLRGGLNRWYVVATLVDRRFDARYDMPQEAVWRMISPMFERGKGFWTITSSPIWRDFGKWCRGDREWDRKEEIEGKKHLTLGESRYIPFIRDMLNLLARWGYIVFQSAGTVWQVTIMEKPARTE